MSGAFPPAVVKAVFHDRDQGRCFRCGRGLHWGDRGLGWSAHHRAPRGAGGSRVAWVSSAANCLIVCGTGTTGCHGWIEAHRAEALEHGWLILRNSIQRADEVPALRHDGVLVVLTTTGLALDAQPY